MFLAVTLEESGLLGSAYYVDNPLFPLAQTVAAFNMDAMYFGGPTRDVTVVNIGASELEDYLAEAAKAQGRVLKAEPTPEKGYFFRSDHFNFAKRGVPALYIKTGVDDREHGIAWRAEVLRGFHRAEVPQGGRRIFTGRRSARRRRGPGAAVRGGREARGGEDLSELESRQRISRGARSQPGGCGEVVSAWARVSGDRAASATLRARLCRACCCTGRNPAASVVGNRKSPNKVTFMSWLFFGSRAGSGSRLRCRARSSAFRSAR